VLDPTATNASVGGLAPRTTTHVCVPGHPVARASIKTAQRLPGHGTATMTLDNYGHLYPDELGPGGAANGWRVCVPSPYRGVAKGKLTGGFMGGFDSFDSRRYLTNARLAQRESASLTRKRSLVQSQYRAPVFMQVRVCI
jgi:hypothetical protein